MLVLNAYVRVFAARIDKVWNLINMQAFFMLIARLSSKTIALAIDDGKLLDSTTYSKCFDTPVKIKQTNP